MMATGASKGGSNKSDFAVDWPVTSVLQLPCERLIESSLSPNERDLPVSPAQPVPQVKPASLTFQDLLFRLQGFWAERGCVLQQPYDVEVGAGTMSPGDVSARAGAEALSRWAYAQPSRRPADGRYGENPNRLFKHTQFQLILKPPPVNVQELYLESLEAIGIDLQRARHQVRRGQLGVAGGRRVGRGLAGDAGRPGDYAVHVFPAVRRDGSRSDLRAS